VIIAPSNTGGALGKADPEAVKKKYIETFGGDERGNVMALSAPTDVKILSWSPQQMNLKELRRIPEERITAVLGVSAIVAGLGAGLDRSTFTNFGEARRAAYQESIVPLQRLIAAELETQLLTDFADLDTDPLDVDFDTSKASALQDALDAVWRRMESAATKGLITRAAFKQGTGQPVSTDDEIYIMPNNYFTTPVGGDNPPDPAPGSSSAIRRALVEGVSLPLLEAGELRCAGEFRGKACGKKLAVSAGPGTVIACERCGHVTTIGDSVAA
jgi:hypothetical protein